MPRKPSLFISGQKTFGAAVLRQCAKEGYPIVGVAAPTKDADAERADKLRLEAELQRVPWIDSALLKADTLPDGVDLIIAAHSHAFLGRRTRAKATLGAIGYHPSLLPRHRGRDAIRWTVHMGDPIAGGTVFWLSDNVDAGDIAAQEWCWVPRDATASDLWRRDLFPMGLRLISEVLADLTAGRIVRVPQPEEHATWEPSWDRPPLYRPDLHMIGALPEGYTVYRERER